MSDSERDEFLRSQRTARVASVGSDGAPHVMPLWFVWDGSALWLTSLVRSKRWADLRRDPRCSVVVDAGDGYDQLRGIELSGRVEVVGEVPRTGEPNPELEAVEAEFGRKYRGGPFQHDGRHAWLRLRPEREFSWDFAKI